MRFPWGAAVLAFLAFGIAGYGIAFYLTGHPLDSGFLQGKRELQAFTPTTTWTWALVIHVAGGSLALIAGGFQWVAVRLRWRAARPKSFRRFHLVTGVAYGLSILVSSAAGLVLAPQAMGGWVSALGFGFLDVFWFATTLLAVLAGNRLRKPSPGSDLAVLRRNHRSWMIRSYALTAAAITLRLWLPIFALLPGLSFLESYVVISWLCWVPNLVVAQWLIRRTAAES